jgi:hypothetical protein
VAPGRESEVLPGRFADGRAAALSGRGARPKWRPWFYYFGPGHPAEYVRYITEYKRLYRTSLGFEPDLRKVAHGRLPAPKKRRNFKVSPRVRGPGAGIPSQPMRNTLALKDAAASNLEARRREPDAVAQSAGSTPTRVSPAAGTVAARRTAAR